MAAPEVNRPPSFPRVFLAVPMAPDFKAEIERYLRPVRAKLKSIKWVSAEQAHITLHFFGQIPPAEIEKIKTCVRPVAESFAPFALKISEVGVFPDEINIRVAWLGLQGDTEALEEMQRRLELRFRDLGYASEQRQFRAHITLGRVRQGRGRVRVGLDQFPSFHPTEMKTIRTIHLYQSILSSKGPRYEILETFPLSAGPPA